MVPKVNDDHLKVFGAGDARTLSAIDCDGDGGTIGASASWTGAGAGCAVISASRLRTADGIVSNCSVAISDFKYTSKASSE